MADGDVGEHTIHEVRGTLGHAAAAAAGAEAAALAGKGDQPLQRAGVAPEAGEAVGEDAAGKELAEFLFDEPRETGAGGALGRLLEKGLQVGADDGVEAAVFRVEWAVGRTRGAMVPREARTPAPTMPNEKYATRWRRP